MARRTSKKSKVKILYQNPDDMLKEKAYHIWESKGRPSNSALEDWLEAKRQLKIA